MFFLDGFFTNYFYELFLRTSVASQSGETQEPKLVRGKRDRSQSVSGVVFVVLARTDFQKRFKRKR